MPSFSSPFPPFPKEKSAARRRRRRKRRGRKRPIFFRAPGNVSKTVAALLFLGGNGGFSGSISFFFCAPSGTKKDSPIAPPARTGVHSGRGGRFDLTEKGHIRSVDHRPYYDPTSPFIFFTSGPR